jgi:LysR family transcriptional regulator, transcriptional activator of the cysJI operon
VAFEHLKLFRDIVLAKSISRGAAMNEISQSAASQHIQELEREMNIVMLDRSTRPFTLTPAGKIYYDFCRDLLRRRELFLAALDEIKGQVEGSVRVASIYSVGLSEMSRLESEFAARHPNAQLQVEYLRPEKVYESVLTDRADLGLVSYPEPNKEITVIPWREEEMVVAMAPGHPLAGKSAVHPAELAGFDFVAFDEDLPIHHDVDRFLKERDVEVNVTMHFDNVQMIKEAVEFGSGISIAPARILRAEIAQGRLVAIPIATRDLFRPLGIVHRRKKHFTRAAKSFLQLLQETPAA